MGDVLCPFRLALQSEGKDGIPHHSSSLEMNGETGAGINPTEATGLIYEVGNA